MHLRDIVDKIRKNARLVIAEDYEVVVQRANNRSRKFHNGQQTHETSNDSLWVSLRLIHRKQPGRSTTVVASAEALDHLVDDAFDSAAYSSVDPWFRLPLLKTSNAAAAISTKSENEIAGWVDEESLYPEISTPPKVFQEVYENDELQTLIYRKADKVELSSQKKRQALYFSLLNQEQDDFHWIKEHRCFLRAKEDRRCYLEEMLHLAAAMSDSVRWKGQGEQALILGPAVVASILKRISPWFLADRVQQGRSPLSNLLEKTIGSQALTIVDDGTYSGGPQTTPFDLEGCLSKRTVVVDQGELASFLYDTYTATRENRLSTGNFLRAPQALTAQIAPTNFYVKAGVCSEEELLKQLDRGLVMRGVDFIDPVPDCEQEFTLQGFGWWVEKGRPQHAVREITFNFNVLDLFRRAAMVGRRVSFYGSYGAPSILFEKIPLDVLS